MKKVFYTSIFLLSVFFLSTNAKAAFIQKTVRKTKYLPVTIGYDSELAKNVIDVVPEPASQDKPTLLFKSPLKKGGPVYEFYYHDGASDDPTMLVAKTQRKHGEVDYLTGGGEHNYPAEILASKIFVPGDGFVYSSGRQNYYFETKLKWQVVNNTLVEVKQSSYDVNLKTKANKEIVVYQTRQFKKEIARIQKGEAVHVVLAAGDMRVEPYLLIKNQFGIMGWMKISGTQWAESQIFPGIIYAGD